MNYHFLQVHTSVHSALPGQSRLLYQCPLLQLQVDDVFLDRSFRHEAVHFHEIVLGTDPVAAFNRLFWVPLFLLCYTIDYV